MSWSHGHGFDTSLNILEIYCTLCSHGKAPLKTYREGNTKNSKLILIAFWFWLNTLENSFGFDPILNFLIPYGLPKGSVWAYNLDGVENIFHQSIKTSTLIKFIDIISYYIYMELTYVYSWFLNKPLRNPNFF